MDGAAWADEAAADGVAARIAERDPGAASLDDRGRHRVAVVAGASPALGDLLVASPAAREVLAGDLAPEDAPQVRARCDESGLVVAQRLGVLRVAARDLLGLAGTEAVAAELSDLADGVVGAATQEALEATGGSLAVLALGKLGGRELNYVSDIDVVFAGDGNLRAATAAAERLVRALGEVTGAGRAYEVDTNLRPEGKDGPLVRSLDAFEAYWRRWARPWEFQALLKARPVAGDRALGDRLVARARPFVWPDRLDAAAVAEIQALKGVVEGSASVRRAGEREIKLAPGGLRDIEFAVQLLQLVHGRHDASLRHPGTLPALRALSAGGYVGRDDAAAFADAYLFLRTVEHRLQIARLRRTHLLPSDEPSRRRLARSLGFLPGLDRDELERFDTELARVRGLVRTLHAKLFYRPLLARFAELSAADQLPVGTARGGPARGPDDPVDAGSALTPQDARERLAALGFADPAGALRTLEALAGGSRRRAQLLRTMLPAVLPTLAAAPDPDGGLLALRSLVERSEGFPHLLRVLRDTPPVADLLARVLGSSRVVGGWLERQPEVLGAIVDTAALEREMQPGDYRRVAEGVRRRSEDAVTAADALRRMRRREMARTAVRNLAGLADTEAVGRELSGLAEACLQAAVDIVSADGLRVAVIGMGRLGGAELGYASDLDILLVFEPADQRAAAEAAAEGLVRLLSGVTPEGQAFQVDLNLRPEGKDGPLVRSIDSYRAYYERWAEPWELQALTQARPVAGDQGLGTAFVDAVSGLVFPDALPPRREEAMRRMKARVESERGVRPREPLRRGGAGRRREARVRGGTAGADLKTGRGGLIDVEWTVQLLQQRHGGAMPSVSVPGVRAGLRACAGAGLIGGEDARWLEEGWELLTRVRNALALAGLRSTTALPPAPSDLDRVARMLGYPRPGAQALSEDVSRVRRRVRRTHERIFFAGSAGGPDRAPGGRA